MKKTSQIFLTVILSAFIGTTSLGLAGQVPTTGSQARAAPVPAVIKPSPCVPLQHSFWLFDWLTRSKEGSSSGCVTATSSVTGTAPLILGTGY